MSGDKEVGEASGCEEMGNLCKSEGLEYCEMKRAKMPWVKNVSRRVPQRRA